MRILLGYRQDYIGKDRVYTYSNSVHDRLVDLCHDVTPFGPGHKVTKLEEYDKSTLRKKFDLLLELDCGRDTEGNLAFQLKDKNILPSAVWFIDSHGYPTLHHRLARLYTHTFFAVYSRRDLFSSQTSAHWLPNATDSQWFHKNAKQDPSYDFGFFGSKGGLDRADELVEICKRRGWTYDVRQINKAWKHRWPHTGDAMLNCRNLFNHGQKHDLNLRIFESMATGSPLICDRDPTSGIDLLFEAGKHYLPYTSYTKEGLEDQMQWVKNFPKEASSMGIAGYNEVMSKHLVMHRVNSILEVVGG